MAWAPFGGSLRDGGRRRASTRPVRGRTGADSNEPSYADAVRADGHQFLFQVNEEGWPVAGELEDVIEEYLWGYGPVYFYGTPGADGIVREVVAGFIDF
ncbi:hypothetical protein [Amycolatopsis dendrobii]|uniref:Uncharacterized protein n=1 Tax=Amycolatopsis dendrobii TaxID=2760662 RepID=A0A7W3Z8W6_9PSEU|nr:hypothetical protein [Amycolatopsis dendrobii]MBB1152801.1 hypothetical protein [Amycolatopsis dendrobii]